MGPADVDAGPAPPLNLGAPGTAPPARLLGEETPGVEGLPFLGLIPGDGVSLTAVYGIWIGLVLALYPLCRWFNGYKQRNAQWWLSYV